MAVITVAGPMAAEMQQALAAELARHGHDCAVATAARFDEIDSGRLARTEILCSTNLACDAALFAAAPQLRAIVTPFLGVDTIDVAAASAAGVLVARGGAPEHFLSMAEATVMLMLAACYDLPRSLAGIDPWGSQGGPAHRHMLTGRRVGVFGYGSIARALCRLLAGWNIDLVVHNRTRLDEIPANVGFVGFEELFRTSDIVVVLVGLAPETRHIIDRKVLALMKEDAILVNTARGALVDEAALIEWLEASPSRKAALDVFEIEPLPAESPLRRLANVVLTPHSVGLNRDSANGIFRFAIENILTAASGSLPKSTCNRDVADQWLAHARPPAHDE
jgi:phosphoglycerate dehydrogenase-like enzyme